MGSKREHFIGDEITKALVHLSDRADNDFELMGRHPDEVDFTVEYHGGDHILIEEHETES